MTLPLTYVLPIRTHAPPDPELTEYLRGVSDRCPVIVVDGSPTEVFDAAHDAWSAMTTHIPPSDAVRCTNGKVRGVLTGLRHVTTEAVIIADDDVRYSDANLHHVGAALAEADLVIPQNYFDPLPWHARWDTARTLLNRVTGGDFPGTLGVRTARLQASGGYDGNVLFENLELIRTVHAVGGSSRRLPDCYVRRRPPTARHFLGQRVRQAYDEFARPKRLALWLAVLPWMLTMRRRPGVIVASLSTTIVAAEAGRRVHGGRHHFPWSCSLFAPMWVMERAVCVWLALVLRARGGVPYSGSRIARSANPTRRIRAGLNREEDR